MENSVENALAYARSFAELIERLAKLDIVVRRLHCDWGAFGSWTVEASRGKEEDRRSLAVQRRELSGPGATVFRVAWDGKDRHIGMASTPTTAIAMLNQWRSIIETQSCESYAAGIELAYQWLRDHLGSYQTR